MLTVVLLAGTFAAGVCLAQEQGPPPPASPATAATNADDTAARHLVRRVIENELRAEEADHTHWMYTDRMQEPGKTDVKEVVETDGGDLKLLVSRNDQPVSPAQRKKEMANLEKLASDPVEQQSAMRSEHEDGEKARRMLKVLPDAFIYTIQQTQGHVVTLSFQPDPKFHPPSREGSVLHAMAGTMMLNMKDQRLVGIRGHLLDEVRFGFGILGHLDKGGQFLVKQTEVEPGLWEIAEMDVQMTGKALFFKSIALHQKEFRSEYRRLPDNLPPQQGLAMLIHPANTVAQRQ